MLLLGLDVGTTAVKALLIDESARPVAEGACEYALSQPRPGWSEQNAEDWWSSVVTAARQACEGLDASAVGAIAVSTQGDTLVPVDAQCRPLGPARTWMDTRGAELIPALEERLRAAEWYARTGSTLGPYAAALTIVWLREHRPEVYRQSARFALVEDFVIQRLTGEALLDEPNASRTLLFGVGERRWDPALLAAAEVDAECLAPCAPSGTVAGALTDAAAEALGLPAGIPVAVGGHDQTCAAVGAGVVRPGTLLLSCGTAWVELAAVDEPLLTQSTPRPQTYCHAARDRWALLTAHAGGNVLAWLRETLYAGTGAGYGEIVAEAQSADTAGAEPLVVLPQFYGGSSPEWLRSARGVCAGLTLGHTRGDVALGLLRGVALEVRRNLDAFRAMGAPLDEVRMIGGGARSLYWAQCIADATGLRVALPEVREAAAYGAAILAGAAAGVFRSVDEVVGRLPVRASLAPAACREPLYDHLSATYNDLLHGLRPIWERRADS